MVAFCPIIKESCKKNECLAWKNDRCLIFTFLDLRTRSLELDLEQNDEIPLAIPDEITSVTPEKLAEELFAFVMKEPDFGDEENDIFGYFWELKKIDPSDVPKNLERKIERVEQIARRKIDKEIQEQHKKLLEPMILATPQEIAEELFSFAMKELSFDDNDPYIETNDVFEYFWEQKKIDKWNIARSLELKIEKAEKIAQEKIGEKQQERYRKILENENTELPKLVDECVKWAGQHGFKKITYADLDAYLLKKKVRIHSETRRDLYTTVNLDIKTLVKKK